MKKLLILLFMLFFPWFHINVLSQVKVLKIGDKCPPELLSLLEKTVAPEKLKLPIVIDFWATWCSPCLEELPKIDSLQSKFVGKIRIISMSSERKALVNEAVKRTFKDREPVLKIVAEYDKRIFSYFRHRTVPHYVLVDRDGVVKAITDKVDKNAILNLVNHSPVIAKYKADTLKINHERPIYATTQLPLDTAQLMYLSVLSKTKIGSEDYLSRGENFISAGSKSIIKLYQIAYGKFNLDFFNLNKLELGGFKSKKDSVLIGYFGDRDSQLWVDWKQLKARNMYDYELRVPPKSHSFDELFQVMQDDINKYLRPNGYSAELVKRKRWIRALVVVNENNQKFKSGNDSPVKLSNANFLKMQNQPMQLFLSDLSYLTGDIKKPLVNKTGYMGRISIEINKESLNPQRLNEQLRKYGLEIKEQEEEVDIIRITKH